ncbi:VOC family protein [Blastococcus sp. TF02A-35]|uniref:VOC family protein n=1 Tax=Blastococcus sp. TF02A-35 TaxID=2559612 RepID=UPI00107402E9|nr:VOC family protein [Blastococcus sp. TF02A_35]TFV45722.1 VOC family protein [Blastococcus sp. TF02A_35]
MPTRETAWPAGTPCWVDYGAGDVPAAQSFYADVFGWGWTGGDAEYGGYLNALLDGQPVAGLGPNPDAAVPNGWTTYFATDDSRATVAAIREAGGTVVVEPMQIGPLGTMTIAVDPQGHGFGLWESGEHTGVRRYNEPGSLVWNGAAVEDTEKAREFYTAVFGFRWEPVDAEMDYSTFATTGDPLGGLGGLATGGPAGWSACFAVASTDDAVARVRSGGGTVTMAPMDTPYGRFAVVADPWGAAFSVMEVAAA